MIIYFPDQTSIDIQIDDSSYHYQEIMGDNSVTLNFDLAEYIEIPLNAAILIDNEYYQLLVNPKVEKIHERSFHITAVFSHITHLLTHYTMRECRYDDDTHTWDRSYSQSLKFSLTATPLEHLKMVVDNVNYRLGDETWRIGTCITDTEKVVTYDYNTCYEALGLIAETFGTEFEVIFIEGKYTVNLRIVEYNKDNPINLSYGQNNGLVSITRSNYNDAMPISTVNVQSSNRNIDYTTYGHKNLVMPDNLGFVFDGRIFMFRGSSDKFKYDEQTKKWQLTEESIGDFEYFTTSEDGTSLSLTNSNYQPNPIGVEETISLEDIYPSYICTITDVQTNKAVDITEQVKEIEGGIVITISDAPNENITEAFVVPREGLGYLCFTMPPFPSQYPYSSQVIVITGYYKNGGIETKGSGFQAFDKFNHAETWTFFTSILEVDDNGYIFFFNDVNNTDNALVCGLKFMRVDNSEDSQTLYDIVDSNIPNALNYETCKIAGVTPTIVFQTGMLAGREFDWSAYLHESRKFLLINKEEDGIIMPEPTKYYPQIGDKFVVYGVSMPTSYIVDNGRPYNKTWGASYDLLYNAAKYLFNNKAGKQTYEATIDSLWLKRNYESLSNRIRLGSNVLLTDTDLVGENSFLTLRIKSIKKYINNPRALELELGEIIAIKDTSTSHSVQQLATAISSTETKVENLSINLKVQADWNQTDATKDDYIKNKPTIPSPINLSALEKVSNKVTSVTADSTDEQYPTAKLLYDSLQALANEYAAIHHTHTIADVIDLTTKLAEKAATTDLAAVAFSGDYDDLSNKPTIQAVPTNVSVFTNDAGYLAAIADATTISGTMVSGHNYILSAAVSAINITSFVDGYLESNLVFTVGSASFSLSLPSGTKVAGTKPTWENGAQYIMSAWHSIVVFAKLSNYA